MTEVKTGSIEDRVYTLVAEERGMKPEELTPTSTLSYDLGMEGDDAVEFFERFAKEFSVDLKALRENWDFYFAPEGVSLRTGLLVLIPGSVISICLIPLFPRLPDWICFVCGISVWMACLVCWNRWRGKRGPQITIQDLVDCATIGIWTKQADSHHFNEKMRGVNRSI